jgi:adenosylcobinamide-phosphate synthase
MVRPFLFFFSAHGFRMTWLSIAAALLAQRLFPFPATSRVQAGYTSLARWLETGFNAGERNSGAFAYAVLALICLVPLGIIYFLLAAVSPILAWACNVLVLYASMTFWWHLEHYDRMRKCLEGGDVDGAKSALQAWSGENEPPAETNELARRGMEHMIVEAHHGLFGTLFWFCLLPGPLGIVLYQATRSAQREWERADSAEFGWLAREAWRVMDWLPQRIAALSFAVVGNFEDAMFCWREQVLRWNDKDTGVLLASAAGALGVRLGGTLTTLQGATLRPDLGTGELADAESMTSAEGILWRGLVLWVLALLLFALAKIS